MKNTQKLSQVEERLLELYDHVLDCHVTRWSIIIEDIARESIVSNSHYADKDYSWDDCNLGSNDPTNKVASCDYVIFFFFDVLQGKMRWIGESQEPHKYFTSAKSREYDQRGLVWLKVPTWGVSSPGGIGIRPLLTKGVFQRAFGPLDNMRYAW